MKKYLIFLATVIFCSCSRNSTNTLYANWKKKASSLIAVEMREGQKRCANFEGNSEYWMSELLKNHPRSQLNFARSIFENTSCDSVQMVHNIIPARYDPDALPKTIIRVFENDKVSRYIFSGSDQEDFAHNVEFDYIEIESGCDFNLLVYTVLVEKDLKNMRVFSNVEYGY